jgi:heptosyltransferase-2
VRWKKNVKKILVITKYGYLGDTIVATPFMRELRAHDPEAAIDLLSGKAIQSLLLGCPWIDHYIPFSRTDSRQLSANLHMIRFLRAKRYDSAYLLNRSIQSAMMIFLAGIPHRIGFNTEYRRPLLTLGVHYDWSKPDRECALDLLRASGLTLSSSMPELRVSEQEKESVKIILKNTGVDLLKTPLIVMQPGVHDPEVRQWAPERFAFVADKLCESTGSAILLTGSEEDSPEAERVLSHMKQPAVSLAGKTTLRQALAIISLSHLWVGNDCGMLHAAVALGTPTVSIFGPTKAPRWAYEHPLHRTMVVYPEHPVKTKREIRACLDAIKQEPVLAVCMELLESKLKHELT